MDSANKMVNGPNVQATSRSHGPTTTLSLDQAGPRTQGGEGLLKAGIVFTATSG